MFFCKKKKNDFRHFYEIRIPCNLCMLHHCKASALLPSSNSKKSPISEKHLFDAGANFGDTHCHHYHYHHHHESWCITRCKNEGVLVILVMAAILLPLSSGETFFSSKIFSKIWKIWKKYFQIYGCNSPPSFLSPLPSDLLLHLAQVKLFSKIFSKKNIFKNIIWER